MTLRENPGTNQDIHFMCSVLALSYQLDRIPGQDGHVTAYLYFGYYRTKYIVCRIVAGINIEKVYLYHVYTVDHNN